jgi:signal transduction histidine kinase/CheY-like chemotaxis protein
MNSLYRFYNYFRNNGRHYYNDPVEIRYLVHLNLIWMGTYGNLVLFTALIPVLNPHITSYFFLSMAVIHALFWIVFFMCHYGKVQQAKHLFLLTTYGMLTSYDHYFGFESLTSLYYISFLPTALNTFSFKTNRIAVIIYTTTPFFILLISNLFTYQLISIPPHPHSFLTLLRIMNMAMAFLLAVIYISYMTFNPGTRQTKLITQSVALQTTLNNALGAIWSIDRDYKLLAVNNQFIQFAEKEFKSESIKPGFDLSVVVLNPEFPPRLRSHYERVFNGENLIDEFTYKNKTYEIKGVQILNEENTIIGATFTSRDISNKKEAEANLLNAKLTAEEEVQAKTRFRTNRSQEIRTPLNGIVGITNILLDEEHLESQEKNLETLSNLSEHTLQLINNILDLSKIEAGKAALSQERFHLLLLVNKLKSIFESTARHKKIDFQIHIDGNADTYIKGDEVKINQVLFNLLGNAFKFTEEGFVKLTIAISETSSSKQKVLLKFIVEDSGIGIKAEDQTKIFESFTQADSLTTRKFGGTGLGITISEKLLSLMNSSLQLKSNYGKGSCFWFELELTLSSFEPSLKNELKPGDYLLPGIHILLAEDNKINQMVAKRMLEKWKATVTVAENGKEAYEQALSSRYDVILMDLDMPVMDGYESASLIKASKSNLFIIALTAAAFEDMDIHLKKKGFDDVVQKPFKPYELFSKISKYLQQTS